MSRVARSSRRFAGRGLPLLIAVVALAAPRAAYALNACTAAQISAQDSGCPNNTNPCNITKNFDIGNGCTLNFGSRVVTVTASGLLDLASGSVTIIAGSFTVAAGGFIDGRGTGPMPPDNHGATLAILTTGNVAVQRTTPNGRIDLSGDVAGGSLLIDAGGSVTIAGEVVAESSTVTGEGGEIIIRADGDVTTQSTANVSVKGGNDGIGGGFMDIDAAGRIHLASTLDADGSDGGLIELLAGEDIEATTVRVAATGDAGSGGCINLVAGTQVLVFGDLLSNGSASGTDSGGGCGGFICVEARFGSVILSSSTEVAAQGALPDGGGGSIFILSRGAVQLPNGASLDSRGNGTESCGGEVCVETQLDFTLAGLVDVSGGGGGGCADIVALRNATVSGTVDVSGRSPGGIGGGAFIDAGQGGIGSLIISGLVDAGGGACSVEMGCGAAGFTDVAGCNVTLTSTGRLLARGPDAGDNCVSAREQLTVQGTIDATTTTTGLNGANIYERRVDRPVIQTGSVSPPAMHVTYPPCSAVMMSNCLVPCPTCGNGAVEYPESCDSAGTPVSCDGCSIYCRNENCNDGNSCTTDMCSPNFGCGNIPVSGPCTPAPTPSFTRTPTRTPTFTHTPTPTVTPTPTPTVGVVLCNGGTSINPVSIKLTKLGGPVGDEKIIVKGSLVFGAGMPASFSPSANGAQLRIDDLGSGGTAVYELSHLTDPIPPGGVGSGCGPDDGWKSNGAQTTHTYKNKSNAIDPPTCTAGSARGFRLLKLKDKRSAGDGIPLIGKAKNADVAAPVGPLRLTVVLGATAMSGANGECGSHAFAPASCRYNGAHTTLLCR